MIGIVEEQCMLSHRAPCLTRFKTKNANNDMIKQRLHQIWPHVIFSCSETKIDIALKPFSLDQRPNAKYVERVDKQTFRAKCLGE